MAILQQGQQYMGGTVQFDSATGKPLAQGQTTVSNDALTPAKLAPATPIIVPPKPETTIPNTSGVTAQITANNASIVPPVQTEDTGTSLFDKYMKELSGNAQPNSAQTYAGLETNANISGLTTNAQNDNAALITAQQKLQASNAQIQALNNETQNNQIGIPLEVQQSAQVGGANVTKGGLAPIQTAQLRNAAIDNWRRAVPLQAQTLANQAEVASAQGKAQLSQAILQQAQDHLDKLFSFQMQDATAQYNYKSNLIDKAYEFASGRQKEQLAAKQREDDKAFELKKDAINNQQALSQIALESGQGELAGKIAGLDPNSKTFREDIARLQGGIKDKKQELQLQLVQEQILTQRANRKNAEVDQLIEMAKLGDTSAQKALGITPSTSNKVPVTQKEAATLNQQITQNDNYKAIDKSISSWRALSEYEKLVKDVGATNRIVDPLDTAKSQAVWNTALLNLKEYYNLGVLNGPDLDIMQQLVPSNVKGALGTVAGGVISDYITKTRVMDAIKNQKVQFEDKLDTDYLSVRAQYKDYSPDQLTNLQDLDRKYLQMKATIDPAVSTFLKENPNLTIEEKLQVINTRL